MNSVREIQKINDEELLRGIAGTPASWHTQYSQSPWVYVGNLDQEKLTEGDVVCVFSQYGEIDDMHLVRDETTGKSRGFAFIKYEDSRSCVLAVDNFCGITLCGRTLRVDHVEKYRLPKHITEKEEEKAIDAAKLKEVNGLVGHAYQGRELASQYTLEQGQDLFAPVTSTKKTTPSNMNSLVNHEDDKDQRRSHNKDDKLQYRIEKEQRKRERAAKRMEREERRRNRRAARTLSSYREEHGNLDDDNTNSDDASHEERRRRRRHKHHRRDRSRDDDDSESGHNDDHKKKKRKKERRRRHHTERLDNNIDDTERNHVDDGSSGDDISDRRNNRDRHRRRRLSSESESAE